MGKVTLPRGCRRISDTYVILDKWVRGVRISEHLHNLTDRQVCDYVDDLISKVTLSGMSPRTRSLTVRKLLNDYWSEHLSTKKYGKDYSWLLTKIDTILGGKQVVSLSKNDIMEYKRVRGLMTNKSGELISKRTIQADLALLSAAVNHAVDNGRLPKNHIKRFCSVKLPRKQNIVLDGGVEYGQEYRAILAGVVGAEARDRVELLYETGMRPSELWRMRGSWIDEGMNFISVPHESEKTETFKRVPISDRAADILRTRIPKNPHDLIFSSKTGEEVKSFFRPIRTAIKAAGLDSRGYTLYALRRSRITIWDAIDPDACRYAVGHSPRDCHSRNYLHFPESRLLKLVGKVYKSEPLWDFCVTSVSKNG